MRINTNGFAPEPTEFHPQNKAKYTGTLPIILRSKLERELAMWLDRNKYCVAWGSESNIVPYFDPTANGARRNYHIDFFANFKQKDGTIKKYLIEVKPSRQTKAPKNSPNKKENTLINEINTYKTNMAKWNAAKAYAKTIGCDFIILTEKDIHIQE